MRVTKEILSTLLKESTADFGDGYSRPNRFRMVRFSEIIPEEANVATLSRQLEKEQLSPLERKAKAESVKGGYGGITDVGDLHGQKANAENRKRISCRS